jgi:hypothetical protein
LSGREQDRRGQNNANLQGGDMLRRILSIAGVLAVFGALVASVGAGTISGTKGNDTVRGTVNADRLATGFATSAAGSARTVGVVSNSATFTDPAGDAKGAPDITTVTISDDANTGMIQITATVVGITTIDPSLEPDIDVYLDTDKSTVTGNDGDDYDLYYVRDPEGGSWDIGRWNGSKWEEVPQSTMMSFSRSGDTVSWRFSKADVGGTTGFNFWAGAAIWNTQTTPWEITAMDQAPDGGVWTYELSAPAPTTTTVAPVKPLIGSPTITPGNATAGKRFTISFRVTRSDNGAALTVGRMICNPSIQGKVLPNAEQFKAGVARLSLMIPKNAKGKLLKVKVTIKLGSQSATKVSTFRIK